MSQGNPELARQGYEVLNRGEIDRFLTEFVHPDYEFHTGVRVPSIPSVVRGRDGLRAWIRQWYEEPWEGQLHMDVERIEELDNGRVLALLTRRTWGSLGPLLLAQPGGQGLLPGGEAVDPKAEPLAEREDVGVLGVDRDAAPAALGAQRWAAQRSAHEASEAPASASPSIGPGATGGRAASQGKLRELQRASAGAAARLRRAEAGAPPPRPPRLSVTTPAAGFTTTGSLVQASGAAGTGASPHPASAASPEGQSGCTWMSPCFSRLQPRQETLRPRPMKQAPAPSDRPRLDRD